MNDFVFYTQTSEEFKWRAEDSFAKSKTLPIFSIADGVTMTKTGNRPDYNEKKFPTPPRLVADIFCSKTIEYLEKIYSVISKDEVISAYNFANDSIKDFYLKNKAKHEFGCTGAVVAVLENKIIGSRFLDCGFALIRKDKIIFKTPEFWSWKRENELEKNYPYINLNKDLSNFVQTYEVNFNVGDLLLLFTDGFEKQFLEKEFIQVFKDNNLKKILKNLESTDKILSENNHSEYGHERTILIIKL